MRPVKNYSYTIKVGDHIKKDGPQTWSGFYIVDKLHSCTFTDCQRIRTGQCLVKKFLSFKGYSRTYCIDDTWIIDETRMEPTA